MKLLALALLLPLCGCSSLSTALKGSSVTIGFTPVSLGPVGFAKVELTIAPHK